MRKGFIDWTDQSLNLYVVEKGKHIDSIALPADAGTDAESLSPFLKTGIAEVYLSVPSSLLTIRELNFPFTEDLKIREILPFELEGLLLGTTDDYAISHLIAGRSGSSCRVLAACIEKSRLSGIISTYTAAGLEPKVITCLDLRLCSGNADGLISGLATPPQERMQAALNETEDPSVNLRQEEFAYTGDIERSKRLFRVTASLILVLLIMIAAHSAIRFSDARQENRFLTGELSNIYSSVFPEDRKVVEPVRQFKGNLSLLKEKKAAIGGVSVLEMLKDISTLRGGRVVLDEFSADGKNIIVKGAALSYEEVDGFRNSLSSSFAGVKVISSEASADKKINFTLLMQEKGS